jgi:hypothetical protein
MKRLRSAFLCLLAACVAISCAPSATDGELGQMCENLVKLRDEIDGTPESERVAKEEQRHTKELKRLEDWKVRDLKSWDDELATKIAELEKDDAVEDKAAGKKALEEEYAKKKEVTAAKHDEGIKKLMPKKDAAIEAAKKKAAAAKTKWAEAVEECKTAAIKEGVNQTLAQCRIAVTSKDAYWNKCR